MEKYTMFMDQKNQYDENEYNQSNLQIQCNPYQATSHIFHRTRTNNFKIALAIRGFLYFHTNCEIICSSSVKNTVGSLIGIALNL